MNKLLLKITLDLGEGGINIGKLNITKEGIQELISKLFNIALIILFMYIIIKIGNAIINRSVKRKKKLKYTTIDEKKHKTIAQVLKSVLRYAVYFFGITGILTQIFGTLSFAFAGIGGVALGFGAQSLIKDVINGLFILFEEQFSVGDYIDIEDKSGIVESIELRVTKIRDFNGDLHIIPNGLISKVTNHSSGHMKMFINIDIDYNEDINKTIDVLTDVCKKYALEEEKLIEQPEVVGVTDIKDNSYTIKIVGKVKSMSKWECENELRKRIKYALDEKDIHIA